MNKRHQAVKLPLNQEEGHKLHQNLMSNSEKRLGKSVREKRTFKENAILLKVWRKTTKLRQR
jgi:hypothetical protein